MSQNKQYYNISEVSNLVGLKEHVIRHWDSIDPKTKTLRISGLSMRTKGGTRYFNQSHIKKILKIKNIIFEGGKHNYTLDIVNKIVSSKKMEKQISSNEQKTKESVNFPSKLEKIKKIINNLKKHI
tara:strand:+ start:5128 stop:5505 length:378 start_codon:yes stop_codon:yes gene_type:complete